MDLLSIEQEHNQFYFPGYWWNATVYANKIIKSPIVIEEVLSTLYAKVTIDNCNSYTMCGVMYYMAKMYF